MRTQRFTHSSFIAVNCSSHPFSHSLFFNVHASARPATFVKLRQSSKYRSGNTVATWSTARRTLTVKNWHRCRLMEDLSRINPWYIYALMARCASAISCSLLATSSLRWCTLLLHTVIMIAGGRGAQSESPLKSGVYWSQPSNAQQGSRDKSANRLTHRLDNQALQNHGGCYQLPCPHWFFTSKVGIHISVTGTMPRKQNNIINKVTLNVKDYLPVNRLLICLP